MVDFQNEGITDRLLRIIIGLVSLLTGFYYFSGIIQILSFVVAFLSLATGLSGICLLYKFFKISTK